MRIISGSFKGTRLKAPKQLPVRPTTDRAKEALFNILNNHFHWDEIKTLDLFSGTGNISFELASRGVQELTAVDQNKHCVYFIDQTAQSFDMPITVIKNSVERFLSKPAGTFDFIFADPPYVISKDQLLTLAAQLLDNNWLSKEGLLVIEHDSHLDLSQHPLCYEDRIYGSSRFSFFSIAKEEE